MRNRIILLGQGNIPFNKNYKDRNLKIKDYINLSEFDILLKDITDNNLKKEGTLCEK